MTTSAMHPVRDSLALETRDSTVWIYVWDKDPAAARAWAEELAALAVRARPPDTAAGQRGGGSSNS